MPDESRFYHAILERVGAPYNPKFSVEVRQHQVITILKNINVKMLVSDDVKPQEDELLSSRLLRIAAAHGLKLNLFCAAIWSKELVMGRDVDRLSDERVINLIAEGTGVTPVRVAETTL
jgi:hypothetical protein